MQGSQDQLGAAVAHAELMKRGTTDVAVKVIRLTEGFERSTSSNVISNQMVRSATSIGANHRAAQRSRSRKEFAARLGVVVDETDETMYWIEIAVEVGLMDREQAKPLWSELNELVKVLVASVSTARLRSRHMPA